MRPTLLLCVALLPAFAADDPVEILRKSVERDANNFSRLKNYTFIEREEQRELDGKGKVRKTQSETNEILILLGRPYYRLVARNDKPLSQKDQASEQRKLDRELEKRQKESEQERGKFERERNENRRFLQEIPDAYNLSLVDTEMVSGKPVWVIDATPKPGYKAKLDRAKILTKVHAKFWIDQAEYQWVRVDAEALDTLSFGLGLIRIAPGGRLHFEQTRVNDEVWLPSLLSASGSLRLAYIKRLAGAMDVSYKDYRKFQSDSHLVTGEQ